MHISISAVSLIYLFLSEASTPGGGGSEGQRRFCFNYIIFYFISIRGWMEREFFIRDTAVKRKQNWSKYWLDLLAVCCAVICIFVSCVFILPSLCFGYAIITSICFFLCLFPWSITLCASFISHL